MRKVIFFINILLVFAAIVYSKGEQEMTAKEQNTLIIPAGSEMATIGGGCFWCVEAVFERIDGIYSVVSGYAGGDTVNPDYKEVSTGTSGHAEVIQLAFNPEVISYGQILDIFFKAHDPTTLNRQGADEGSQYRSIILYHTAGQKKTAEAAIEKAAEYWEKRPVTELTEFKFFYPAEDYHQDYYELNTNAGYCQYVIAPKLNKLGLRVEALPKL